MSLTLSGTDTSFAYNPSASIQPFKNVNLSDSSEATNPFGLQVIAIQVNDIEGGPPTDADGTFSFTPSDFLKQLAPGVYAVIVPGINTAERASTILSGLNFTPASTPTTAVFTITAKDIPGDIATDNKTQVVTAIPPAKVIISDLTSGSTYVSQGVAYTGPASSVANQYIVQDSNPALAADNLNITATAPNSFIHTGGGNDAIDVSKVGGVNVLDGGDGSNFLTGGKLGSGTDTFFLDARNASADIWSTVSNFHAGDAVTLFGFTPTNKSLQWLDNQGAAGSTGLTLHASQAGKPPVSLTLAGYTTADLSNGRLGISFGGTGNNAYMYINELK